MQGSVQKRKTEIALWEMDQPKRRPPKRNGRRRPGDVDIIDLYPEREAYPDRRNRNREMPRIERNTDGGRRNGAVVRRNERAGRGAEPARRREVSVYDPGPRTAEPIGISRRRAEEPVRRKRAARRIEEEWDVDLIGQDWEEPRRRVQPGKRRKAKKRRTYLYRTTAVCVIALCLLIAYMAVDLVYDYTREDTKHRNIPVVNNIPVEEEKRGIIAPAISEDFLEINDFSRPGTKLPQVNSIFVHYTANPGTSASQNRSYFANLAETQERSASAHFIIGYEGEIVQCMPLDEQAYAVMTRNEDSISIECCYLDEDGQFTQETYDSLVHLLAWLEQEYDLGSDDILRHYDCGGKKCPVYYVDHEEAWDRLLADVETYKAEHK